MKRLLTAGLLGASLAAPASELVIVKVDVDVEGDATSCQITTETPNPPLPQRPLILEGGDSWLHGYTPPESHKPRAIRYFILEERCEVDGEGYSTCRQVTLGWDGTCGANRCFMSEPKTDTAWSVCAYDMEDFTFICSPRFDP